MKFVAQPESFTPEATDALQQRLASMDAGDIEQALLLATKRKESVQVWRLLLLHRWAEIDPLGAMAGWERLPPFQQRNGYFTTSYAGRDIIAIPKKGPADLPTDDAQIDAAMVSKRAEIELELLKDIPNVPLPNSTQNQDEFGEILVTWAQRSPDAALDWITKHPPTATGLSMRYPVAKLVGAFALHHLPMAAKAAVVFLTHHLRDCDPSDRLKMDAGLRKFLLPAIRNLVDGEAEFAVVISALKPCPEALRERAMLHLMRATKRPSLEMALTVAQALPPDTFADPAFDEALLATCMERFELGAEPDQGVNRLIASLPGDGPAQAQLTLAVTKLWARENLPACNHWLKTQKGASTEPARKHLALTYANISYNKSAKFWCDQISDATLQQETQVAIAQITLDLNAKLARCEESMNAANTLFHEDKFGEAETAYLDLIALHTRELGSEHFKTLRCQRYHVAALVRQRKWTEAEESMRYLLYDYHRLMGANNSEVLAAAHIMAVIHSNQGKTEAAEREFRSVLEMRQRTLGKDHPETADTWGNFGETLLERDKIEEAIECFRTALTINESKRGPEQVQTLQTRSNLADALRMAKKYDEACAEHTKVLTIRQRLLGDEHTETLIVRRSLARLLYEVGKFDEAERGFRAILNIREKVLGPDHLATMDSYDDLSGPLQRLGRFSEAVNYSRVAMEIADRKLEPTDSIRLGIHFNLAVGLKALAVQSEKSGDGTTARKLLNEALTHAKLVQTQSIMDAAHPYRKEHDDLVSDLQKSLADLP